MVSGLFEYGRNFIVKIEKVEGEKCIVKTVVIK